MKVSRILHTKAGTLSLRVLYGSYFMQGTLKFNNYNMLLSVTDPMLKSLLPASSKREMNRFSANFSIRKIL